MQLNISFLYMVALALLVGCADAAHVYFRLDALKNLRGIAFDFKGGHHGYYPLDRKQHTFTHKFIIPPLSDLVTVRVYFYEGGSKEYLTSKLKPGIHIMAAIDLPFAPNPPLIYTLT